jgi:FkbM family methyltransferase
VKDKWISRANTVGAIVNRILPESGLKFFLRHCYDRWFSPFYILNNMINKVELLKDDVLFVELNNGMKFYGQREHIVDNRVKHANPQKLDKIKGFEYFVSVWGPLHKQFVECLYEKYYRLKRGDIVVDAGAHIGTFTIKAARIVGPEGMVIAIEPDERNLSFLKRNIEENGLENVVVVPKGVWSRKDKLKLLISSRSSEGNSFGKDDFMGDKSTDVEVDSLDNILQELGINRINFIKMNIEGAEIEALKGMDETLRDNNVNLAIEAAHFVNGKGAYEIVNPQLKNRGFEVRTRWKGLIVYGWKR